MNLQQVVDFFVPMTCIMSVEKFPDGSYGNIRIVAGNQAYLNATKSYQDVGASELFHTAFIPNSPYERYIPKNLNFEDCCYHSAILGETIHSYVPIANYDFWIDMTMMPLKSNKENIYYCTYTQEFTKKADASLMANLSPEISNDVLQTCIKLRRTDDFHKTIDEIIHDIRDMCEASHCCILLADLSQRKCSVLCEALSKETTLKSMKVYVDDAFFDIVETWDSTIGNNSCLIVNDANDWKALKEINPIWYESMYQAGAKSIVLFPLKAHDETLGYIWAINYNIDNTIRIMETLELTTFFLASEISNYQLLQRMKTLSMIDLLTGIYNRNAMNNRVDSLTSEENPTIQTVGIVFADLNGLKRVNDNEGHFAGDMLLKNAATLLKKCFYDCEIYRAGGDEFMMIAVNFPESELMRRVQMLHDDTSVSFAVGFCTDTVGNLRQAMRLADERMYADKEAFYQKHSKNLRN